MRPNEDEKSRKGRKIPLFVLKYSSSLGFIRPHRSLIGRFLSSLPNFGGETIGALRLAPVGRYVCELAPIGPKKVPSVRLHCDQRPLFPVGRVPSTGHGRGSHLVDIGNDV